MDHKDWQRRITATAERYQVTKLRRAKTTVERLSLLELDGGVARSEAAQDDIQVLREYADLLAQYCRILMTESGEP